MKKTAFLFLTFLICSNLFALENLGQKGGEFVLKVNKISVYQNKFQNEIMFMLRDIGKNSEEIKTLSEELNVKNEYAKILVNQIVILEDARAKKFFNSKKEKEFINIAKRNAKSSRYAQTMIIKYANEAVIPEDQIDKYIKENKNNLENMKEEDAKKYVEQYLKLSYAQTIFENEVAKYKSEASVIYNTDALDGDKKASWIMKVNGKTVPKSEFETEYAYAIEYTSMKESLKQNRGAKEAYLDGILIQYILVENGEKEGFFSKPEEIQYIDYSLRSAKTERYLRKITSDYTALQTEPSDYEIKKFLEESKRDMSEEDFKYMEKMQIETLVSYIKNLKLREKLNEYVRALVEKAQIEYNENYFK